MEVKCPVSVQVEPETETEGCSSTAEHPRGVGEHPGDVVPQ